MPVAVLVVVLLPGDSDSLLGRVVPVVVLVVVSVDDELMMSCGCGWKILLCSWKYGGASGCAGGGFS